MRASNPLLSHIFIMDKASQLRIGIVSDTHGHLDPRIATLIEDCDIAVHAGDIMGQSVLEQLRPRSGQVVAVRGNNDVEQVWHRDEHDALGQIQHEASIELPGGSVAVVHGHQYGGDRPQHDMMRERFPQARAIIYGHSHKMVCDLDTSPWVINPGAAGRIRTRGGPSCLILEASHGDWQLSERRFSDDNA